MSVPNYIGQLSCLSCIPLPVPQQSVCIAIILETSIVL